MRIRFIVVSLIVPGRPDPLADPWHLDQARDGALAVPRIFLTTAIGRDTKPDVQSLKWHSVHHLQSDPYSP
jgi:hypothetical protein